MSYAARKWDDDEARRPLDMHEQEPIRCTLADLATMTGEPPTPTFIADCEKYFSHFVKPVHRDNDPKKEMLCFHCGEALSGMIAFLLSKGGGFQWGLVHGEGFCGNCHWPARAYHFAKNDAGEDLFTIRGIILSYHPDEVESRDKK